MKFSTRWWTASKNARSGCGVDVSGAAPPHRLLTRAFQQLLELLVQFDLAAGDGVLDPVGRGAYRESPRLIVSRSASS